MSYNKSSIGRFLNNCDREVQKCVEKTDQAKYAINLLQEGHPYTIDRTIIDKTIYNWDLDFIDKVIMSMSTTIVQSFSRKEKDLFDRYRNFYIYKTSDIPDDDVKNLDKYLGTIGTKK